MSRREGRCERDVHNAMGEVNNEDLKKVALCSDLRERRRSMSTEVGSKISQEIIEC